MVPTERGAGNVSSGIEQIDGALTVEVVDDRTVGEVERARENGDSTANTVVRCAVSDHTSIDVQRIIAVQIQENGSTTHPRSVHDASISDRNVVDVVRVGSCTREDEHPAGVATTDLQPVRPRALEGHRLGDEDLALSQGDRLTGQITGELDGVFICSCVGQCDSLPEREQVVRRADDVLIGIDQERSEFCSSDVSSDSTVKSTIDACLSTLISGWRHSCCCINGRAPHLKLVHESATDLSQNAQVWIGVKLVAVLRSGIAGGITEDVASL